MENVELKTDLNIICIQKCMSLHRIKNVNVYRCAYATGTHWSIQIRSVLYYNSACCWAALYTLYFIDESVQPNNVHFFSFLFIYSLTSKKTRSNPPVKEWFNQAILLLSIDGIMFRYMCLYQIDLHWCWKITTIDSELGSRWHGTLTNL